MDRDMHHYTTKSLNINILLICYCYCLTFVIPNKHCGCDISVPFNIHNETTKRIDISNKLYQNNYNAITHQAYIKNNLI